MKCSNIIYKIILCSDTQWPTTTAHCFVVVVLISSRHNHNLWINVFCPFWAQICFIAFASSARLKNQRIDVYSLSSHIFLLYNILFSSYFFFLFLVKTNCRLFKQRYFPTSNIHLFSAFFCWFIIFILCIVSYFPSPLLILVCLCWMSVC